ncbi:peptidylprolyl isomerase [Micavibrio aeruginosavorus]|uniref:Foldase protein PrsA n=1 Tax=Micavibrio aeruginosavorus EPB TaxID=349215 RepID=M4VG55_9BACT|nr:peptidylprolyl isomerase [Micavibrio aeruginosavorus]AGH98198.1 Foldase protein PrsA precursor [Micavibrio aeruginosavorus EPB]
MTAENKQGQSKTVIALAAVAVLAIGAGGFVFLSGKGVNETDKPAAAAAETPADTAAATPADGETIQTPAGEIIQGNPVVAKVAGEDVTRSDVLGFIAALPENMRAMPLDQLFPMAQEQVINNKIVDQKAAGASLEQDPEVVKMMEMAKGQIVRNIYVQRQLDKGISEAKLKAEYDSLVKQMGKVEEVKARHILVDSEDKAKELITKLDGGADFETLSRENSTGPTAENGGDLGYFTKGDMIPEFSDAAFALKVGEYTKAPVKTQFGWHVIKLEDKRNRPAPAFEDVKPQVEAKLRQEELGRMVQEWQKEAKIERFDINGKPIVADAPKADSAPAPTDTAPAEAAPAEAAPVEAPAETPAETPAPATP